MLFSSLRVNFLALSYGICFSSCHRNSDLLKFQKCSRVAQNALAGWRMPNSALTLTLDCHFLFSFSFAIFLVLKPFFTASTSFPTFFKFFLPLKPCFCVFSFINAFIPTSHKLYLFIYLVNPCLYPSHSLFRPFIKSFYCFLSFYPLLFKFCFIPFFHCLNLSFKPPSPMYYFFIFFHHSLVSDFPFYFPFFYLSIPQHMFSPLFTLPIIFSLPLHFPPANHILFLSRTLFHFFNLVFFVAAINQLG